MVQIGPRDTLGLASRDISFRKSIQFGQLILISCSYLHVAHHHHHSLKQDPRH